MDEKQEFEMTEALKALRTNIMFSMNQREHKRIIYTSAVPMEGKTSTSVNFSVILAQTGAKVVLIDADMRKPSVHKILGIGKPERGLSNVLSDGKLENALIQSGYENLSVMLAGPQPPNPAELLGGKYIEVLFSYLEKRFDYIVIDTPPVNIITDALVLAEHNCSFVLVAHENFSDHREVRRALKSIELVNGDLIGAVLVNSNHAISSSRKGGDGYYYGYKRKKTGRKEKAC